MEDPALSHKNRGKEQSKIQLTDHQVDEDVKNRWRKLAFKWGEGEILECTAEAARLVLIYTTLEKRHHKKALDAGRCLFFFDRNNPLQLHLYRMDANSVHLFKIDITATGQLEFESSLFEKLDDLLEDFTLRSHIVHRRFTLDPETVLGKVLHQNFDLRSVLNFPPDYPPLLVHIALANNDYATAAQILKHPFLDLPSVPWLENVRLGHLLEASTANAIQGDHRSFLDYLLQHYELLSHHTYPLTQAIVFGKYSLVDVLLDRYPPQSHSTLFVEGLKAALEKDNKEIFEQMLKRLPKNISVSPLQSNLSFLASIFEKWGARAFEQFTEKVGGEVAWNELLPALVQTTTSSPSSYLSYYLRAGNSLEQLPEDLKGKMVLKAMEKDSMAASLRAFLTQYIAPSEIKPLLKKALKESLQEPQKVQVLLDAGAVPTHEHFEELLKLYDIGPERDEIFALLLSGILDLSEAKKALTIASAFGQDNVTVVFKKFPTLATDVEFIPQFLEEMWKGSAAAADRLLAGVLSPQKGKKSAPVAAPKGVAPLVGDYSWLPSSISPGISVDILIETYLPRHQLEKIATVLEQKPECVENFWIQALFTGYSNFEGSAWERLVEQTFVKMEPLRQYNAISAAFYYSHLQLASLWLKFHSQIPFEEIFKWFDLSLQAGNVGSIDVFAFHHLLFSKNDKGNSLLHVAAENNAIEFVREMQKYGLDPDAPNDEGISPYKIALARQNITLCKMLHGPEFLKEVVQEVFALPSERRGEWLLKAFLRSSSADVVDLIVLLREEGKTVPQFNFSALDELEKFMFTCGTLIVRYPSPQSQAEMFSGYGTGYQSYEEQQWMWGLECERLYQKLQLEYAEKEHVILEILLKLSKVNADKKDYNDWRMGTKDASLITYFHGRYFFFWQFTQNIYKSLLKDSAFCQGELALTEEGYQVLFLADENKVIPLSTMEIRRALKKDGFKGKMVHTEPKEIKEALPYLDVLLEEIENYRLPSGERPQHPPLELRQKIAKLFWLGCHLAVTTRGSSQYMLLLHRLLYNRHGYAMAPWSLRYIQPDCMAIPLPFSIFFAEYYDLLFDADRVDIHID